MKKSKFLLKIKSILLLAVLFTLSSCSEYQSIMKDDLIGMTDKTIEQVTEILKEKNFKLESSSRYYDRIEKTSFFENFSKDTTLSLGTLYIFKYFQENNDNNQIFIRIPKNQTKNESVTYSSQNTKVIEIIWKELIDDDFKCTLGVCSNENYIFYFLDGSNKQIVCSNKPIH